MILSFIRKLMVMGRPLEYGGRYEDVRRSLTNKGTKLQGDYCSDPSTRCLLQGELCLCGSIKDLIVPAKQKVDGDGKSS